MGIKILIISIVEPLNEVERISSSNLVQAGSTIDSIPSIISDDINAQLLADYMTWEVGAVIKQMAPLKAPGLDGMPPLV